MIGQPLVIRDLHKTYPGNAHPVFQGFGLELEAGTLCAVMGPSGVGKTTLLNLIAALDHGDSGEARVGGELVPWGDPLKGALYRRRHIGLAFQQPHLLPEFTVLENVLMPLTLAGAPEDPAWARALLDQVGVAELADRLPGTLSGGQATRVGLARALVRRPSLWLLDEPTGSLDPATSEEVFQTLVTLQADLRPTTLLVTHNPELGGRCSRVVRL